MHGFANWVSKNCVNIHCQKWAIKHTAGVSNQGNEYLGCTARDTVMTNKGTCCITLDANLYWYCLTNSSFYLLCSRNLSIFKFPSFAVYYAQQLNYRLSTEACKTKKKTYNKPKNL